MSADTVDLDFEIDLTPQPVQSFGTEEATEREAGASTTTTTSDNTQAEEYDPFEYEQVDQDLGKQTFAANDEEEEDEFDFGSDEPKKPKEKPRKRLGPSKKQQNIEEKKNKEQEVKETQLESEQKKKEEEENEPKTQGVNPDVLAAVGLPASHALDDYKTSPATTSRSEDGNDGALEKKPTSEEKQRGDEKKEEEGDPEEEAVDEWNAVNQLREETEAKKLEAQGDAPHKGVIVSKQVTRATSLPYKAATAHYFNGGLDYSEYSSKIQVFDFRKAGFFQKVKMCVVGKPSLKTKDLERERDHLFSLALKPVDYNHLEDERLLQTIYRSLTGDELECPRFGKHWETIGFQGNDPSTDVRGAGVFGLFQLLFFIKNCRPIALRIYNLSRDDKQNFPFAVVSLNITGIVLQLLRETKLYSEINKRGSVIDVANELYGAIFYEMLLTWKRDFCTIAKFGFVLQHLKTEANERYQKLMTDFVTQMKTEMGEGMEFVDLS